MTWRFYHDNMNYHRNVTEDSVVLMYIKLKYFGNVMFFKYQQKSTAENQSISNKIKIKMFSYSLTRKWSFWANLIIINIHFVKTALPPHFEASHRDFRPLNILFHPIFYTHLLWEGVFRKYFNIHFEHPHILRKSRHIKKEWKPKLRNKFISAAGVLTSLWEDKERRKRRSLPIK